jgi:hypothetical protein
VPPNSWKNLSIRQISLDVHLPTIKKTLLGWIVSGEIKNHHSSSDLCNHSVELYDSQTKFSLTEFSLEKFWQLER